VVQINNNGDLNVNRVSHRRNSIAVPEIKIENIHELVITPKPKRANKKAKRIFNKLAKLRVLFSYKQKIHKWEQDLFTGIFSFVNAKNLTRLATVAACILVVYASAANIKAGYDVTVNDKFIGLVGSHEQFDKVYTAICNDLSSSIPIDSCFKGAPKLSLRFYLGNSPISDKELKYSILSAVDKLVDGYAIIIDGNTTVALSDETLAKNVLEKFKQPYISGVPSEQISFDKPVTIEKSRIPISKYMDTVDALAMLKGKSNPLINVKVVRNIEFNQNITFPVKEIKDNSIYSGRSTVFQKGISGIKKVAATVMLINGKETQRTVLNEKIVTSPKEQIVKVGTKALPPTMGTGNFIRPYFGAISSRYGSRWGGFHPGVDLAGSYGDPIKAADNGVVRSASYNGGYGNLIIIDHNNGYATYYGHCSRIIVKSGNRVAKGDVIGYVGSTGNSTGPHLHFEVRQNGVTKNPLNYIK